MAPSLEDNRRRWMRRFRRKENLSQDASEFALTQTHAEMCQTRFSAPEEGDRARRRTGTSKLKRCKTEIHFGKERRDVLPARVENKIYALAETSCNMKKMTLELDTHQKCVTNLAATVVRQNNQIRELKRHIRELTAQLQRREEAADAPRRASSDSGMDASAHERCLATSAAGSEFSSSAESSSASSSSKENDCHKTAPGSIIAAAAALNAMLDEAREVMHRANEKDRDSGAPTGKPLRRGAQRSKNAVRTASKLH